MQTPILFFVALALFWTVFAKFISIPPQPVPAEDREFMAAVVESHNPGLPPAREEELRQAISAYNAKRDAGDIAIWMPPGQF